MNKEKLKEFIKEMVKRKLKEATLGATVSPLQSDVPQDEKKSADDSSNMSDSDKAKMAGLKKQQDKLNNDTRKIDGAIQKLKAPVMRKTQDLERQKAKAQQNSAKIAKGIESLQKKYAK